MPVIHTLALLAGLISPLDIKQVVSINIHSAVGRSVYDANITQRDGKFTRDDGAKIPSTSISALLDAISAPIAGSFLEADSKFASASLEAHLPDDEVVYLGSASHLPRVRSEFEREFQDVDAFRTWVDGQYSGFMNDYYPTVEITVVGSARRITLSTRSQWPFMLPIRVSEGDVGRNTFNPALAIAIGSIMPKVANACHLLGCEVYDLWASRLIAEPALAAPIKRAAATPKDVRSIAKDLGLDVSYDTKEQLGYRNAYVWFPASPRIRVDYFLRWNYEDSDYWQSLLDARRALVAFSRSWLVQHSSITRDARVDLGEISIVDARQPDFRGDYLRGFRREGFYHAAACLERDHLVHFYGVGIELPDRAESDDWLLLENGDLILHQAAQGESIPEGSILRADGSIEFPTSSQPC